ncbi:MAG: hypothetical protein K2N06_12560 [Oscillospiraceae bacterium]|nr:hypothetical protein [Oscillospiraceae bacterium]
MKTSKKILSAVLASTVVLSSYVTYADDDAETELTGLAKKIADAEEGATIELDANETVSETIRIGKSLTIDLKGHTLTINSGKYIFAGVNGAEKVPNITIKDSSEEHTGAITSGAWGIMARYGGTLILENITLTGEANAGENSTLNIKNCKITGCTNYAVVAQDDSTVNITESEINGHKDEGTIVGPAICVGNGTEHDKEVTVTIENSKVTGGSENSAIYKPQKGTLTIKGEKTLITGANGVSMKAGKLVVEGGTIKATGAYVEEVPNNSNGINESGSAIAVAENNAYAGNVEIDIKAGATVESTNGNAIRHFRDGAAYAESKISPEITCAGTLKSATGKSDIAVPGDKKVVKDGDSYKIADALNITGILGGKNGVKADVDTMTGTNLERYNDNLAKYEFNGFKAVEGGFEVTCDVNVGEMKTATAGGAAGNKNVVAVVELDKIDGFAIGNISRNDTALTDASWVTDASKFVTDAKNDKTYVTLWMSIVAGIDGKIPDRTYTVKATADDPNPKTLTVKFNDTTKYTLTKDEELPETNYTVNVSEVTNGKATVTVIPTEGKTITSAKVKKGDASKITLTPNGDGTYSGEVTVKDLLTPAQIADGMVAAKFTSSNLEVETAAQSETVKAVDMTVGIENPPTMAGAELERYQDNRKLYADKLVWDNASKTATVKVPGNLLDGTTAIAQPGANVCLIMQLEGAIDCSEEGALKWSDENKFAADSPDIIDGYKFVDATSAADTKKYVALWINGKFAGDRKTVILYDKDGAVVATVNLVKIPGVKPSAAAKPIASALTDTAIITAAKTLLTGDVSDDNLDFAVGTLPTEAGTSDVTVTATTKGDTVLVDAEGNVVTGLELTVSVTVAEDAKYTADVATATNGTVALKYKADKSDTELTDLPAEGVTAGTEVTIVLTANSGYKAGTVTVKNAISGETVTVTNNKFTMPIGGVTVSATFTANSTSGGSGSSGGSWGGGGSSSGGGSGSSASTGVTLNTLPYATISADKNAFSGEVTAELKAAESTTASGVTVKTDEVEKAADGASIKIEAPKNTYDINTWSRELVKSTPSSRASEVKKSVDEAIKTVGDGNGFALYATITKDGKSVEPDGNVEITVSVPEAFKGKELHVYRITNRGAVEILANTANNRVTFMAGGSGEYIFTTEKLTNVKAYEMGNVDGNEHTNAQDATLTLKYLIRSEMLKDEYLFIADADGNGMVNAADATAILKYLVEKA